jgi:hypothetical protein
MDSGARALSILSGGLLPQAARGKLPLVDRGLASQKVRIQSPRPAAACVELECEPPAPEEDLLSRPKVASLHLLKRLSSDGAELSVCRSLRGTWRQWNACQPAQSPEVSRVNHRELVRIRSGSSQRCLSPVAEGVEVDAEHLRVSRAGRTAAIARDLVAASASDD